MSSVELLQSRYLEQRFAPHGHGSFLFAAIGRGARALQQQPARREATLLLLLHPVQLAEPPAPGHEHWVMACAKHISAQRLVESSLAAVNPSPASSASASGHGSSSRLMASAPANTTAR